MKSTDNKVPKHIGIIMDGNRRFAKRLMIKPWKGHEWGAKKIESLLEWSKEIGVKELTLYAFSIENFNRPKDEFDSLMNLFVKEFDRLKDNKKLYDNKIRINVIGRIELFPEKVKKRMYEIMERTKGHDNYIVNFAMAYGGRAEVIDATKKISEMVKKGEMNIDDINEEVFQKNLYMDDEPEIIIRTGGEKRLSNFLMWQSNYAELFFVEKMWPEFEKEDFLEVVHEYGNRQRRFGR